MAARSPFAPRRFDWLAIGGIGVVLLPLIGAWAALAAPLLVIVGKTIYLLAKGVRIPDD